MANRRVIARAPVELPLIVKDTEMTDHTWEKYFTTLAEYTPRYDKYEVAVDVSSVAANTTSEQTVTVNGVATNDFVTVSKPTHSTGLGIVNIRVSAINTVAITFMNCTGSAIDPASETYTFKVEKI